MLSNGFTRDAYPARGTGFAGVIVTDAMPADQFSVVGADGRSHTGAEEDEERHQSKCREAVWHE